MNFSEGKIQLNRARGNAGPLFGPVAVLVVVVVLAVVVVVVAAEAMRIAKFALVLFTVWTI